MLTKMMLFYFILNDRYNHKDPKNKEQNDDSVSEDEDSKDGDYSSVSSGNASYVDDGKCNTSDNDLESDIDNTSKDEDNNESDAESSNRDESDGSNENDDDVNEAVEDEEGEDENENEESKEITDDDVSEDEDPLNNPSMDFILLQGANNKLDCVFVQPEDMTKKVQSYQPVHNPKDLKLLKKIINNPEKHGVRRWWIHFHDKSLNKTFKDLSSGGGTNTKRDLFRKVAGKSNRNIPLLQH